MNEKPLHKFKSICNDGRHQICKDCYVIIKRTQNRCPMCKKSE